MKKIGFLVVVSFLAIPLAANATLLGAGSLDISWSTPTGGGYYLDYDGQVTESTFGYTTGLEEVFCVSSEYASYNRETYFFYSLTEKISDGLSKAAWIADHWTTWGDGDEIKGEAQKAVWQSLNLMGKDWVGTVGTDLEIFSTASSQTSYTTENWYWAVNSPTIQGGTSYQDYLTPANPVPEPATMLLLGSGLIGLAGLGRKKLFKK